MYFKKTKIVCTMGPATDRPGVIEGLLDGGMGRERGDAGEFAGADCRVGAAGAGGRFFSATIILKHFFFRYVPKNT